MGMHILLRRLCLQPPPPPSPPDPNTVEKLRLSQLSACVCGAIVLVRVRLFAEIENSPMKSDVVEVLICQPSSLARVAHQPRATDGRDVAFRPMLAPLRGDPTMQSLLPPVAISSLSRRCSLRPSCLVSSNDRTPFCCLSSSSAPPPPPPPLPRGVVRRAPVII